MALRVDYSGADERNSFFSDFGDIYKTASLYLVSAALDLRLDGRYLPSFLSCVTVKNLKGYKKNDILHIRSRKLVDHLI